MLIDRWPLMAEADDGASTGGMGGGGGDGAGTPPADTGGDAGGAPPPETGGQGPAESVSVRDALEKAFDAHEQETPEQRQERIDRGDGRDATGKFVPKPKPDGQQPPQAKPTGQQPPAAAQTQQPELKPPSSWKPEAKAEWAKLTPAVRNEIVRREVETGRAMQESAQARAIAQEMNGLLAPFAHNIRATGKSATDVMTELFTFDNNLRHGSPQQKAQLVAQIIGLYGVDIGTLDAVLAGAAPKDDPQARLIEQIRGEFSRQLQPMQAFMQTVQQRQLHAQQTMQGEVNAEVQEFSSREFFDEVRDDMADMLENAARRGVAMTMEQAYNRAIRLHPTLSETVLRRDEQARVQKAREAAQRARAAAVSRASGSPAGHGAPAAGAAADTVRGALESAFDQHADS